MLVIKSKTKRTSPNLNLKLKTIKTQTSHQTRSSPALTNTKRSRTRPHPASALLSRHKCLNHNLVLRKTLRILKTNNVCKLKQANLTTLARSKTKINRTKGRAIWALTSNTTKKVMRRTQVSSKRTLVMMKRMEMRTRIVTMTMLSTHKICLMMTRTKSKKAWTQLNSTSSTMMKTATPLKMLNTTPLKRKII